MGTAIIGAALGAVGITAASLGISATAFTAITLATSAALSIGLSIGVSALTNELFVDKPKRAAAAGSQLEMETGGSVPRKIAIGHVASRGALTYYNQFANGAKLQIVKTLADWQCNQLLEVWVDGTRKALIPQTIKDNEDARFYVEDYDTLIEIKWFSGRPGQTADLELVANADPPGRWTTNDVGTSVSYVNETLTFGNNALKNRRPDILYVFEGALMYDPRQDSTHPSGSGSQRENDLTTWQYSANPAVAEWNYRRGFRIGTERLGGMEYDLDDLEQDTLIASMNVCDEQITENAVTRNRYEISIITSEDQQHSVALTAFANSMAGFTYERAGVVGSIAGAAQTPVRALTDADFAEASNIRFSKYRNINDIANAMYGTFIDPNNAWDQSSYPAITNSAWEFDDKGKRETDLSFKYVPNQYQARRCALIRIKQLRAQASLSADFPYDQLELQAGDWVTYSGRYGTWTFRIQELRRVSSGDIRIFFHQTSAADYDDPTGAIVIEPPISPTIVPPPDSGGGGAGPVDPPLGIAAALVDDGDRIRVTVTPSAVKSVNFLGYEIRYGGVGTTFANKIRFDSGLAPTDVYDFPVLPPGTYELGVRAVDTFGTASTVVNSGAFVIAAPTVPTNVQVAAFLDHMLVLFDGSNDAVRATIYARTDAGVPDANDIIHTKAVIGSVGQSINVPANLFTANVDYWWYVSLSNATDQESALIAAPNNPVRTFGTSLFETSANSLAFADDIKALAQDNSLAVINAAIDAANNTQKVIADVQDANRSVRVIANAQDASFTVAVDNNGVAGGFKLGSDGSTVDAVFAVDTFFIGKPNGSNKRTLIDDKGFIIADRIAANDIAAHILTADTIFVEDIIIAGGGAIVFQDTLIQAEKTIYPRIDRLPVPEWITVADFSIPNNSQPFYYKYDFESTRHNPGQDTFQNAQAFDQHHQRVTLNDVVVEDVSYNNILNNATTGFVLTGSNWDVVDATLQPNLNLKVEVRSVGQPSPGVGWNADSYVQNMTLILMALKG